MGRARWRPEERVPVWPQPLAVATGSSTAVVTPRDGLIVHSSGCCASLLAEAIDRYHRIIFWVPASGALPYLRVRTPGGRTDARPPELCDASDAAPFGTLRIVVEEAEESPLQLGVDESYSLSLTDRGGTLTAPSVWGALRGLESFAQLIQWDGDRYVLCGLPLTLSDRPRFAWRGLLIDTARHFLPVPSLHAMLDGMAALKLNTLHWHLTDAHAFPLLLDGDGARLAGLTLPPPHPPPGLGPYADPEPYPSPPPSLSPNPDPYADPYPQLPR